MPQDDEFSALSKALDNLRDGNQILTDPFLELCRGVLPVIGHFGSALAAIVRSDVGGNIERLEKARQRGEEGGGGGGAEGGEKPSPSSSSSSSSFRKLFSIPQDEIDRGADLGAKSDAKALLWLKRAMDFILLMLRNLLVGTKFEKKNSNSSSSSASTSASSAAPLSVTAAARAAYNDTLRKYHGFVTGGAFSAALSLAPSRATFFSAVAQSGGGKGSSSGGGHGDDSEAKVLPSLSSFVDGFEPVLREIDEWFRAKGLNDPMKV